MVLRAYTTSKDGTDRTTVTIRLRLDIGEIIALEAFAKAQGRTLEDLVECEADLAIEGLISDIKDGRAVR